MTFLEEKEKSILEPKGFTAGQLVGKILKEEGVEYIAGIHGGHIWAFLTGVGLQGIKLLHVRHEQTGAYIADGWARTTGRPMVCFGTAGPGMLNMVPGLAHAFLCQSPVVGFVGQHEMYQDGRGPFQEAYAEEVCRSITKWTKRIVDPRTISYHLQKAFRDAVAYPPGPVVVEIGQDILLHPLDLQRQIGYIPKEHCAELGRSGGDPVLVEKAVRMLMEAERPVVIGGNGIFWSKASEELKELVELLQIPVHTRRNGRGAVPETHPLAFSGGYRRPILNSADVIVIFGLRMDTLEGFGAPPTYSHEAKYILVSESLEELDARMPSEIRLLANPKLVLRQMIHCAKELMKKPPKRAGWLEQVRKTKESFLKAQREDLEKRRDKSPIDPHDLAQKVVDFLDDSATIIWDSFSMSGFTTDKFLAKFAGQVLDSGTNGGMGHSVGMGIGAQLGRPGKEVLVLLGDGGMGVAGFDIETAARYKIPVVYLLFNNSGWMSPTFQPLAMPIRIEGYSWAMLPDIRYDKIFEEQGCHGEFVTEPQQILPALERAFHSGKTSVINVIPDNDILPGIAARRVEARKKL